MNADPPTPSQALTVLTPRQLRATVAALLMTILLAALDQTIVGVAVPSIADQLGGFEWMAWVISGYLIAATVVTPLYGKLGDKVGRRRVLIAAIGLFLIASVACALARTMPQLVLARVLQGAGGGGLIATAQAVIADVVPLRERGRYQSYVSIVWAVASLMGPVVGGVLTEYLSWPWIFWINLPVGLLALALVRSALRSLPAGSAAVAGRKTSLDILGAVLLLTGLTALLLPITRVGQGTAWNDAPNLGSAAAAAVLLALFVARQRRHPDPIVPLSLFANPVVVACCGLLFATFFNFIALSVLVPLRLQLVAGLSPADSALRLLPLTVAVPAAAFLAGRWLFRSGRVLPALRLGTLLVPLGLAGAALAGPGGVGATAALLLVGAGMGLQMPTVLLTVQQSVARSQIGTVTALIAFFRLLGGAVGIAVLSSIVLGLLHARAPAAAGLVTSPATANDSAFRVVLFVSAALALVSPWLAARLPDVRLHDGPATRPQRVAP